MRQVLVGLLDSGIDLSLSDRLVCVKHFVLDEIGRVHSVSVGNNGGDHATVLANIIAGSAPQVGFLNAQVFDAKGPSSPAVVAAGLTWLVEQGAEIINMSFGLRADRKVLRDACSIALEAGVLLVAAMPAQGAAVYPANYPGVIRVTGDARCAAGEFSYLDDGRVDFGACLGPIGHVPHQRGLGSSLAVAHVTARLANYLASGGQPQSGVSYLRSQCSFFGREKRT